MNKILSFAALFVLLLACENEKREVQQESIEPGYYMEKHRPQFHFSPEAKWMNDPNGMVFYEGEYHLFYQYYPDSTVWGPMHWGHAVSKDMVKWEHLPVALYPDSLGYIFSGGAVIDWENTSGFGTDSIPPMIAFFTYHDPEGEKANTIDFQYQGMAYSLDKGRSWTKYEGNPIIPNPGIRDFRDPKVAWNEKYQKWTMVLAVKDHISFYSSIDLKEWKFESDFGADRGAHGGVWECPDLFKLKDQHGDTKYILLVSINPGGPNGGSATQYFVGDFDGSNFIADHEETLWLDFGRDNYAGVTWSDIPESDGRRLFIGWMSNWDYAQVVPTEEWRSAMTLPRELILLHDGGNHKVQSKPVTELEKILGAAESLQDSAKSLDTETFKIEVEGISENIFEIVLSNNDGETVTISFSESVLSIDRRSAGNSDFSEKFASLNKSGVIEKGLNRLDIFVDVSSVEVFANEGELVMTDLIFPSSPLNTITYSGEANSVAVRSVNSIW